MLWSADENGSRGELEDMILARAWYSNACMWIWYAAVKRSFCHEITRWASGLVSVGACWETKDRFEWPFCWQIKCNLNAAGTERGESVNCCSTRHLFSRRAEAEAVIQITHRNKQSAALFVCNMSRVVQSGLEKGCKSGKQELPPFFQLSSCSHGKFAQTICVNLVQISNLLTW